MSVRIVTNRSDALIKIGSIAVLKVILILRALIDLGQKSSNLIVKLIVIAIGKIVNGVDEPIASETIITDFNITKQIPLIYLAISFL